MCTNAFDANVFPSLHSLPRLWRRSVLKRCFSSLFRLISSAVRDICAPIIDNRIREAAAAAEKVKRPQSQFYKQSESARATGEHRPKRGKTCRTSSWPWLRVSAWLFICVLRCVRSPSYIIRFLSFTFLGFFGCCEHTKNLKERWNYKSESKQKLHERIIVHLIKLYVNRCYCATVVFIVFGEKGESKKFANTPRAAGRGKVK